MNLIEDYALIGDGHSAALVHRHGSIDWLCWPRFDSDTAFAALLGHPENGHWSIMALDPILKSHRRYCGCTAVLESTLELSDGTVVVTDYMPWNAADRTLVRHLHCTQGKVRLDFELMARFGYGKAIPWVRSEKNRWRMVMGPFTLWLDGADDMEEPDSEALIKGQLELEEGDERDFVLRCVSSHVAPPGEVDVKQLFQETLDFWNDWTAQGCFSDEFDGAVQRSLITLKLLSSITTGGVVAAPTSSLPELLGGEKNWDYRYCWLRDASFTLLALIDGGHHEEASAWRDWLVRAIAGHPAQLQIMYTLDGSRRVDEWKCDWLPGYESSKPVRFGNAAAKQRQIDIYGEVLNSLYVARARGLAPDPAAWELECALIKHLEHTWQDPGHGLWEMRGDAKIFTESRAAAWIAVDRALRSAKEFNHPAPIDDWEKLAEKIRHNVLEHGFNKERNSFTQIYGGKAVDASLLLLPIHGFIDANEPRMAATVTAIERELTEDGLLLRYRHDKESAASAGPGEGTFLACSFWLAHVQFLQGRTNEAHALFNRLLSLSNDVGLLSEEYDVHAQRLCGNFPQALSHIALVNTAVALTGRSAGKHDGSGVEKHGSKAGK